MENEGTTLKAAKREFMSWKSSTKQAQSLCSSMANQAQLRVVI